MDFPVRRRRHGQQPAKPYYLHETVDERNQHTVYKHNPDTGLVREIDYPDTSVEAFEYQVFPYAGYVGNTFSKVSHQQTRLGANIYYTYDEANHGGSATWDYSPR